jgi:LysM repeat protein
VLATLVNASPVASPEANASSEIAVHNDLSRLFSNPNALQKRDGCTQTYTVVSGDTCSAIELRTGVSDAQLHALNPAINGGCTSTFCFYLFLLILVECFL